MELDPREVSNNCLTRAKFAYQENWFFAELREMFSCLSQSGTVLKFLRNTLYDKLCLIMADKQYFLYDPNGLNFLAIKNLSFCKFLPVCPMTFPSKLISCVFMPFLQNLWKYGQHSRFVDAILFY